MDDDDKTTTFTFIGPSVEDLYPDGMPPPPILLVEHAWSFNVVVWKEEGVWLASALEVDITAQAKELSSILGAAPGLQEVFHLTLARRVFAHRHEKLPGDPFEGLPRAPEDIFGLATLKTPYLVAFSERENGQVNFIDQGQWTL